MSELPEKLNARINNLGLGHYGAVALFDGDKKLGDLDIDEEGILEIVKRYDAYPNQQAEVDIMKAALKDATCAIEARDKQIADQQTEIEQLKVKLENANIVIKENSVLNHKQLADQQTVIGQLVEFNKDELELLRRAVCFDSAYIMLDVNKEEHKNLLFKLNFKIDALAAAKKLKNEPEKRSK